MFVEDFSERISEVDGLYNIQSPSSRSYPEYVLSLKPLAVGLNLTLSDLSNQVRSAFMGQVVDFFQRDQEKVNVHLKNKKTRE